MRRRFAGLALGFSVLATTIIGLGAPSVSATEANRVGGADRYETAVQVARRVGDGQLSNLDRMIVVTGENFPDALAASGLAGYFDRCPSGTGVCGRTAIVLTRATTLPTVTRHAIRASALPASRIIVLGGPAVVAPSVHAQIAEAAGWNGSGENPVLRIAGADRYETATAIVDHVRRVAGASLPASYRTVLVANGEKFPDALAAGSIAYANGHLLVLSRAPSAPPVTVEAVENLQANCAILIGGNVALSSRVSGQVSTALTPGGCGVDRIGGADRYETAANIATRFVALNGPGTSVMLTSGTNFADALTMGPLSRSDTPMILTAPEGLPAATAQWLQDNPSNAANINVIGGPDAVPPSVVDDAVTAATPPPPPLPPPPPPPGFSAWPNSITSQGGGNGLTINASNATASGETFVGGFFLDTATFAGATTGSALVSTASEDAFVAKRNADGTWAWAVPAGGTGNQVITGVVAMPDGGAMVSGYTTGTAEFSATNTVSQSAIVLTNNHGIDGFVARVNSVGQWVWVRPVGNNSSSGDSASQPWAITLDAAGSAIVTGFYNYTVQFGDGVVTGAVNGNNAGVDMFVAKINGDGVWQWAARGGGTGNDRGYAVAVDATGSAFVVGHRSGSGTMTFSSVNGSASAVTDAVEMRRPFVAKINGSGVWQWATFVDAPDGATLSEATGASVDATGSAIVSGFFSGTATFSALTPIVSAGGRDAFVAEINGAGTWQWVAQAGGTGLDEAKSVSVLADGSAVVTGRFTGNATVSGATTGSALTSAGGTDGFVARVGPSGTWQWAVAAGGAGNDQGTGVSVLAGGTAVVAGGFTGTATVGAQSLTNSGNSGGFAARLDVTTGTFTQVTGATAQTVTPTGSINALATSTIPEDVSQVGGWSFAVGQLNGTATFLNTAYGNPITVNSAGGQDVYVALLDPDGRYVWVTPAGGPGNDQPNGVSVLPDGSGAVIAGVFQDTLSFGTTVLTSGGGDDVFVAKINIDGTWAWAARAGTPGPDGALAVSVDATGSAFVAGYRGGSNQTFQLFSTNNSSISASGGQFQDSFVAKINGQGVWQWVSQAIGDTYADASGVSVDATGSALVSGTFGGILNVGTTALTSGGGLDVYVARIDGSGNWQWATKAGGAGNDVAVGVTTRSTTSAVVVGNFPANTTATFSNTVSSSAVTLVNGAGADVFIAGVRLADGKFEWATFAAGGSHDVEATEVAALVDGSGAFVSGTFVTNLEGNTPSAGGVDAFIARFDETGNREWLRSAGGTGDDRATGVATFDDGSAVMVGDFTGAASFGDYGLSGQSNTGAFFARISPTGSFVGSTPGALDAGVNPRFNSGGGVGVTAAQSDGKILIGGGFSSVNGVARTNLVRLNADGSVDTTFAPSINSEVRSIAVQSDGRILIGGFFTTVNGVARNRLARLHADGTLDTGFTSPVAVNMFEPRVEAIAVDSTGRVVIGGNFRQVVSQSATVDAGNVARLNSDGTLDTSFGLPSVRGDVYAIAIDPRNDDVAIAGSFVDFLVGSSLTRQPSLAVLNASNGALSSTFVTPLGERLSGGSGWAVSVQSDGKILVGGTFSGSFYRFNTNGTRDTTFSNAAVLGQVRSIQVRSNGKIFIGGGIVSVGGQTRTLLARLNADGTLDTSFGNMSITGGFFPTITSMAIPASGRLVAVGTFTSVGGVARAGVAMISG